MPTKIVEDPREQEDRHRRLSTSATDQPRSFDACEMGPDANFDTPPTPGPDDEINTHGSER